MGTIRTSKRSERVLVALATACVVGCVTPAPPVTAVAIPDAPRRPDAVVVEPSPALPLATEHAASRGVIALQEPLGGEAVVAVVRAFFRGFETEDPEALHALLADDAVVLNATRGSRVSLFDQWRGRLKNLDYGRLAGTEVVRVDRIERYSYADLGSPGALDRPSEMRPGDVLVRVPVATPRVGSEQLFGDVVVLLLRRDGRGYKIAGFSEENGPS